VFFEVVGSHSASQEVKATQGQKPFHYCAKKPATVSQKKKKLTRQDATDPKQKAITDYKEQVDRHLPPLQIHRKTKKQENQYNHNGHNNQEPNQ